MGHGQAFEGLRSQVGVGCGGVVVMGEALVRDLGEQSGHRLELGGGEGDFGGGNRYGY